MSATEPAAKKSRYLLTDWNPNDESKWDSKLAWRTLWITTYSLIRLFAFKGVGGVGIRRSGGGSVGGSFGG